MGLDFDVLEFCKKLRQNRPPPYQCPLEKCDKVYKSLCGLQYHLVNYDHDNPTPATPAVAHNRKKGWRSRPAVPTGDIALQSPPKEALTFAEAQKAVQFEIDGKISRISIDQPLPVISLEEWEKKNAALEKPLPFVEPAPEPHVKLPEASFKLIPDYNERVCDAPPRPNAYIRFIEKSAEELDGEVEYDVDEEDTAWLGIINKMRAKTGLQPVSVDTLELLMDRLEKESYFQASQTGQQTQATVDEDAVCCICMDGECQNTNVILFCDMCNLAVHQDCYGVPYIPEGQWLCRRCLQSPSRLVSCALCPNTGGAFKQTDQSTWAHVVCALWIPEVRFANTVFLEPIDSIEMIPPARWKLQCMVCKQRGAGACIQCHKSNCYSAFHVTCAQQAGLYMKMEAAGAGRDPSQPVQVAKMAYCDAHTPAHILQERKALESEGDTKPNDLTLIRQKGRDKIKQARRVLALKRTWSPVVLVPTLPAERVCEVAALLDGGGGGGAACRAQLMGKLLAYWTLKRHSRNGVPLLRRLQSATAHHGTRGIQDGTVNVRELCNQLKYWQRIRQDLERARLLCELVRKRERVKAEATRVWERCLMHSLRPARAVLHKLLRLLRQRDRADIFTEPVDPHEVPDYSTVVTHPMDLSTMSKKLDRGAYKTIDDVEADFNLMINNCLAYNNKDTVFYKAGIKMREQCLPLFREARRDVIEAGMAPLAGRGDAALASPERNAPRGRARTRERSVDSRVSRREKSRDRESMESDRTFDGHLERALSLARSERDDRRACTRDTSPRRGRTRERSPSRGRTSPSRGRTSPSLGKISPSRGRTSPSRVRTREPSPKRGRTREASPQRGSAKRGRTREPSRRRTPEPSPRRGRARELSSTRGRTPELTPRRGRTPQPSPRRARTPQPSPRRGRTPQPSPRRGSTEPSPRRGRNPELSPSRGRTPEPSPRRGRTREASPRRGRTREPSRNRNRETSPEPSQSQESEDEGDTNSNTQEDTPAKARKPNPWWSRGRGRGRRGRGRGRGRAGRPPAARDRDNETATSGSETPAPPPRAERTVKLDTPERSPRRNKSPRSPKKTPDTKTGVGLMGGLRKPTLLLTPTLSSTTAKSFGADASLPTLSASLGGADSPKKKRRGRPPKKDKDKKSEGSTDLFRLMSGEDKPVSTPVPASFLQYRGPAGEAGSDSDLALSRSSSSSTLWSQSCSSCTHYDDDRSEHSCSLSSSDGYSGRDSAGGVRGRQQAHDSDAEEGEAPATPQKGRGTRSSTSKTPVKSSTLPDIELDPLQLVWAKCRGYPWYPALIIDPKMPRGFVYNGVPLPVPPPEVMSLKRNHSHEPVLYLVLFFDVKRTWQWLPPAKLELLGVEKSVDQSKLVESRKPTDRKAVKKAYADAMQFRKQVDGDEDK